MKFKNELKIIQKNVQQTGIYQLRERAGRGRARE